MRNCGLAEEPPVSVLRKRTHSVEDKAPAGNATARRYHLDVPVPVGAAANEMDVQDEPALTLYSSTRKSVMVEALVLLCTPKINESLTEQPEASMLWIWNVSSDCTNTL